VTDRELARLRNPFLLRLYFLAKLPLALFAGLRMDTLTREKCEVSVPYGWRSTNPFRSTYFAAQAMAAELSTGALAMAAVRAAPVRVALLIVNLEAVFEKKATARATFTCEAGDAIQAAVTRAIETGEPQTVRAETAGRLPDGVVIARFWFTWSFKAKTGKSSD
jgi:Domain of unknown function (DUF4442)